MNINSWPVLENFPKKRFLRKIRPEFDLFGFKIRVTVWQCFRFEPEGIRIRPNQDGPKIEITPKCVIPEVVWVIFRLTGSVRIPVIESESQGLPGVRLFEMGSGITFPAAKPSSKCPTGFYRTVAGQVRLRGQLPRRETGPGCPPLWALPSCDCFQPPGRSFLGAKSLFFNYKIDEKFTNTKSLNVAVAVLALLPVRPDLVKFS